LLIGRVPLAYNARNLSVRWKTNAMTAFAFACVVGLLTFLLAFVNGMNKLTESSGIPGNVFVLSDGSTDEVFSNLGYGDLGNVERVRATEELVVDAAGKPVFGPGGVKQWRAIAPLVIRSEKGAKGEDVYWSSKETYYSVNMAIPNSERRRFVQLRALEDAGISAKVHDVELQSGRWYSQDVGVDQQSRVECVLGAGIAKTLGEDVGKAALVPGDTFELGDMTWVIVGIMKSEGKTYGSEIWVKKFDRVTKTFGKEKYTTLVLRADKDTKDASRAVANFLNDPDRYPTEKLKAFSEPDYYAEQAKTNNFFLTCVLVVCVVMAIGGVFGMMTTMFASIAQRIRDIGVLRLLGFKRWQVMVSFLLESLAVAAVGGLVGVGLAWLLADGRSATSTLSGGGGGPGGKTIALTINVDAQVVALSLLFTFVMGRLGGLVPALSAMRMKILDSLR
jgi:ABC-type lipoprotein release transport system permease subunit